MAIELPRTQLTEPMLLQKTSFEPMACFDVIADLTNELFGGQCSMSVEQSLAAVEENADNALSRFHGIRRLVLLSHGAVGADRWPVLIAAAKRHGSSPGQSVYSAGEVRSACELPGVEKLQVPGNILDNRAIAARRDASVNLDVRSIYLQGILLEDSEQADQRAPG